MESKKQNSENLLTTREALDFAESKGIKLTKVTLNKHARKDGFGYQIGGGHYGRWRYYRDKLEAYLTGKAA
jgi:hypothetical protein